MIETLSCISLKSVEQKHSKSLTFNEPIHLKVKKKQIQRCFKKEKVMFDEDGWRSTEPSPSRVRKEAEGGRSSNALWKSRLLTTVTMTGLESPKLP